MELKEIYSLELSRSEHEELQKWLTVILEKLSPTARFIEKIDEERWLLADNVHPVTKSTLESVQKANKRLRLTGMQFTVELAPPQFMVLQRHVLGMMNASSVDFTDYGRRQYRIFNSIALKMTQAYQGQ